MARDFKMALVELLGKLEQAGATDFLREGVKVLAESLMEAEVTAHLSASPYERTDERQGHRNGYRTRAWDTRVGSLELRVPRVRDGSYFPSLLEPRRRAEKALLSVVQEAYIQGVSTRRVEELVQALGMTGMSASQVSRACAELDHVVEKFRNRELIGRYPYVWLDATYIKVRDDGRVRSMAVVVAVGVRESGEREVLGLDVGPSETTGFWLSFMRSLTGRGLSGVQLVSSDAHAGLKWAISEALSGSSWQGCRVHFLRDVLAVVPKTAMEMMGAAIRTVFAQTDPRSTKKTWNWVSDGFRERFPKVSEMMDEAREDVLAYLAFPKAHWRQIRSTNPLERLNKEIKRRTDVVGVFPAPSSALRLVGALFAEQHEEWAVSRRYFSAESMADLFAQQPDVKQLAG